ncbi:protein of unknown function DUF161 [Desulfatibacillum aliphaticivorans]|uniref:Integral membrane protein n=1 Tax=Desulfatibacillum aliphaticivorans TaxID=218208 RepID=B8FDX5_DESAL|nr:DUF6198 family protein [Desulfatibacillum aliphaticivorans]ACL06756.1 protein of unknown function DUF161 [Desulfatibacillum aliphaticivorans]
MPNRELRRRMICLAVGLALAGLGVALSTQAGLGTTPISSVPYVLTFLSPLSFGTWTFIFNILFIIGQMILLKKEFRRIQYFQLVVITIFGVFIDVGMYLTEFYVPDAYWKQIVELLLGCFVLAAGITCELAADLIYIPGEGFAQAFCYAKKKEFGLVKVGLDVSLVVAALAISLIGAREILGLREGTVIAAFAVGWMIRQLLQHVDFLRSWCYGAPQPADEAKALTMDAQLTTK